MAFSINHLEFLQFLLPTFLYREICIKRNAFESN